MKRNGNPSGIFRMPYPDANTEELVAKGGAFCQESSDGKVLYFAKREARDGIWRQRLPHGTATQVVPELHRRNLFAVSRDGLFYIAPTQGAQYPSLFFQSFQAASARKLRSFEQDIGWGLGLSPDGNTLLVSRVDIGNSDIMLIERFR